MRSTVCAADHSANQDSQKAVRRTRGTITSPVVKVGPTISDPATPAPSSTPAPRHPAPLDRQIEVLDEQITALLKIGGEVDGEIVATMKQTRGLLARLQQDREKPLPAGRGFETFTATIPARCAAVVHRFVTENPGLDPGAVVATGFESWCAAEKEDDSGEWHAEELARMFRFSRVQGAPPIPRKSYGIMEQIAVVEKALRLEVNMASRPGGPCTPDEGEAAQIGALQATRETLRSLLPVAAPFGYRVQLPKGTEQNLRQFLRTRPGIHPEAAIAGMVEQWFAVDWEARQLDAQTEAMMRIQTRQRVARIHPKTPRAYLVPVDAKSAGILERLAITHRRDVHHLLTACVHTQVVSTGAYEGEDFEQENLTALLEDSDSFAKEQGAQPRVEHGNAFAFTADEKSARIIADLAGKHRRPVELIVAALIRMYVAKGSIDIDDQQGYDPEMVDLLLDNCNAIEDGKEGK